MLELFEKFCRTIQYVLFFFCLTSSPKPYNHPHHVGAHPVVLYILYVCIGYIDNG